MRTIKRQRHASDASDHSPASKPPTVEEIKAREDEKLSKIKHLETDFFQQIKNSLKEYETKSIAAMDKNILALLQLHM